MGEAEPQSWRRGIAWICVAYAAALVGGVLAGQATPSEDPLVIAGVADLAATAVIFAFSFAFRNSSFYDAYWSVAPFPIVIWWAGWVGGGEPLRQLMVLACVALWGIRLTANWASGWTGLHHEDWRYVQLRQQTGVAYWLVSLLGLHYFPTVIVFLGLWPAYAATTTAAPLNLIDIVAVAVTLGAVVLEGTADAQLRTFKARSTDPRAFIDEGVWRWSRHPNYLGEMLFWWGIWLFALAASPAHLPMVAGAAAMTTMFVVVSIPLMERRMLQRRPAYASYIARVPMIVPWRAPRPPVVPAPAPVPAADPMRRPHIPLPTEPTIDSLRDVDVSGAGSDDDGR